MRRGRGDGRSLMSSTSIDDEELRRIWMAYRNENDQKARDRLILTYAPLVKYVAGRLSVGLLRPAALSRRSAAM